MGNELQPQLRFPEFENGWIPKKYDEIYSFYSTNSLSRDKLNYESGKVKNIHYGDIHTKFSTLFDISKAIVPFVNDDIIISNIPSENYCQEGDLLIADASEDYKDIGKTIEIVNLDNEKVLAGLHTFLARPNKHNMAVGFAGFMLQYWGVREQVMKIAQGTKVLGLAKSRLAKIKLNIPSFPEQQKIASFLTAVDDKITQLTKKKALLEQYKKGVMQQLFNQEIRFRDDEGGDYPEWEKSKIGNHFSVFMCKRIFAEETNHIGGIPFYKIGTLGDIPDVYISEDLYRDYRAKYKFPRTGEILITCSGTVGKCIPFDGEKAYFQDSNIVWLDNPSLKISNEFLFYILLRVNWGRLNSTTITRIYGSDLKALEIEYPCKQEQTKIANFLSALDDKISQVDSQIEKTVAFKKGLLQQMFV